MSRCQQNHVFSTAQGENQTYNTQAQQAFNLSQQDAGNFASQLAKFSKVKEISTTAKSTQYDEWTLTRIWFKAPVAPGTNDGDIRVDRFGNRMRWSEYGQTTAMGWEVDHIVARSEGGSDDIENLEPLHWKANRQKGDRTVGQFEQSLGSGLIATA